MLTSLREWARYGVKLFRRATGLNIVHAGRGWELFGQETLAHFLGEFKVDCVFDVGANRGQYGIRLRRMGFEGLIISFEPNPAAFAELQMVAQTDPHWVTRSIALDSASRVIPLNIMKWDVFSSLHEPDHTETGRTFLETNVVEKRVSVETETLDRLFPGLVQQYHFSRPFLKMDTQGHDREVVLGAAACLKNFCGLQSELSFSKLYQEAATFSEALALYEERGFKLSGLIPCNAAHFPNLYEIDCLMYNARDMIGCEP